MSQFNWLRGFYSSKQQNKKNSEFLIDDKLIDRNELQELLFVLNYYRED